MKQTLVCMLLVAAMAAADAKVWKVSEGEKNVIQDALDAAEPYDTVLIKSGTYNMENTDTNFANCGLRVSKPVTIRGTGKVVLKPSHGGQEIGVYIAPPSDTEQRECEADKPSDGSCPRTLSDVVIQGITVEGFKRHGIMTRWVHLFEISRCESIDNADHDFDYAPGNGIYVTVSENGFVKNCFSTGSLDTALWVSRGENVVIENNELTKAPTGLEITVSNNVMATRNYVHDNTAGVGLYNPRASGNDPPETMENWIIENNKIWNNNFPNPLAAGLESGTDIGLVSRLVPGIGILVAGVSDTLITKNSIRDNDSIGVAVGGWCTVTAVGGDPDCDGVLPLSVENNIVSDNSFKDNGEDPDPALAQLFPGGMGVDLLLLYSPPGELADGTCFEDNKASSGDITTLALESFMPINLPLCL